MQLWREPSGEFAIKHLCSIIIFGLTLLALGPFTRAGAFHWDDITVATSPGNNSAATEAPEDHGIAVPAVPLVSAPADGSGTVENNLGLIMALVGMVDLPEEIRQYNLAVQQRSVFADPRDVFGKNWAQREPLLFQVLTSQYLPASAESFYELAIAMSIAAEKNAAAIRRYNDSLRRMSAFAAPLDKLYNALMHRDKAGRLNYPPRRHLPDNAEACHQKANVLVSNGKLREAVEFYQEAVRLKPDFAEAHNNFGNVLSMLGDPHQAAEHYQEALRLKPDYPGAHSNLGNALVADGKAAEAIEHYEQALIAWPESPYIHNNLGEALLLLGKFPEAIGHFRVALRLHPGYPEARANLDKALEGMKR